MSHALKSKSNSLTLFDARYVLTNKQAQTYPFYS